MQGSKFPWEWMLQPTHLTSVSHGSSSKVSLSNVGSELQTQLGISDGAGVDGVNVAGTINGVAATGIGQRLSLTASDDAKGIVIDVTSGTVGSRGTVSIIKVQPIVLWTYSPM